MIALLALQAAASQSLFPPRSEWPAYDIPRHFACEGFNRSGDQVRVDVVIQGDAKSSTFLLVPAAGSAWPSKPLRIENVHPGFSHWDGASSWYWVGTGLNLDNKGYGFGFSVVLTGKDRTSLRFSRDKYVPDLNSTDIKFDPKGAYLDDVPCEPRAKDSQL